MAIGQGYELATPLQVLVSTAAVANGGTICRPQIVRQIVDASGGLQRDFEPIAVRDVGVDADLMELVQQGMWSAVNAPGGTAYGAKLDNVVVAGKTGTAEFCEYIPEEEDCRATRRVSCLSTAGLFLMRRMMIRRSRWRFSSTTAAKVLRSLCPWLEASWSIISVRSARASLGACRIWAIHA